MKKAPRIDDKSYKEKVLYLFKGGPGVYGKNRKQSKAEDFVKIRYDTNVTSIPIITSTKIYVRDNEKSFLNKHALSLILIICVVSILLLKFVFDEYFQTERLKSLENLISNLCFAFIASYIFYIIVVRRTEKSQKTEAYSIVCGLVESMISHGKNIKKWLLLSAGVEITQTKFNSSDIEFIRDLCKKADITKKLDKSEKTTAELLREDGVIQINTFINRIFKYMPFLDGELIYYLYHLQNCNFYRYVGVMPFKTDKNLIEFSYDIHEYLELIKKIEKHNNKIKANYLKGFSVRN
ncbi:MAG: hypothetical protein CL530_03815 [Aequorivita sp.]|nr:hypothetical protein [Aequorivita sp.]|tara:strand:+ start:720 stop:1601 length:882 start_codon:yes stop_codon:yes gene_type:complete